jgi:hypothetical protein
VHLRLVALIQRNVFVNLNLIIDNVISKTIRHESLIHRLHRSRIPSQPSRLGKLRVLPPASTEVMVFVRGRPALCRRTVRHRQRRRPDILHFFAASRCACAVRSFCARMAIPSCSKPLGNHRSHPRHPRSRFCLQRPWPRMLNWAHVRQHGATPDLVPNPPRPTLIMSSESRASSCGDSRSPDSGVRSKTACPMHCFWSTALGMM